MSLRLKNGIIFAKSGDNEFALSAEEIYAAVFEGSASVRGAQVSRDKFLELGLEYSDTPAVPTIVVTANVQPGAEPTIECRLAGRVGPQVEFSPVDYAIIGGVWYPLPMNTAASYAQLLADCGVANGPSISFGQYLELQKRATDFGLENRAIGQLAAGSLSAQIPPTAPIGLTVEPYPYQRVGLQWLGFMANQGVGSILADEMGLGKTLQIIGVLLAEAQSGRGPNLVLCPATLLENWRRETNRFAPSVSVRIHAGPLRTGRASELAGENVTVTSYETLAGDISLFRSIEWNLVALDEAQNIKNPGARRTKHAKELKKRVGVAITGTPVENRLKDLWSIFDFVLPGHLGTLSEFERRFPDTEDGASELEPFVSAVMLRRRVNEVAKDLPERIDIPVALKMDQRSIVAYEEVRQEAMARAPSAPDLAALVNLRMFCAHPWAANKLREVLIASDCSPKLERCLEILDEVFASNSKAIIFTSFNQTAELLEREISRIFRVPVWTINGSVAVPERQLAVDNFSAVPGGAALVLNPKAAGVGLNITAANHVIHYNLEWNPATEDQASARAYRRGQTRPVTVHRLFYADTVEETINERMIRKRALADRAIIGTTGDENELSDILNALRRTPSNPAI